MLDLDHVSELAVHTVINKSVAKSDLGNFGLPSERSLSLGFSFDAASCTV